MTVGLPSVLVVEDNELNRILATDVLELAGHEVRSVTTGGDVLPAVGATRPDIVLLDIGLPDMSGEDVLRSIRADADLSSMIMVACTADAMSGDRERLLDLGFDGYLAKPIDVATLSASLVGLWSGGGDAISVDPSPPT